MKRIITAAIAAFLLLFSLCMTAYADPIEGEGSETPTGAEYPLNTEVVNPFTPRGTGTVVDFATGEDGKLFYTIVAPDESVFYLVIDTQRNIENVYFLNAVTVSDLMPLAEQPKPQGGTAAGATPPSSSPTTETPDPEPAPAPQTGGGNITMYIIIAVLAVLGGGAGWYFKIYRPKQQGVGSSEEYEPPADEDEDDPYDVDGWDDPEPEYSDTPPWDEDEETDEEADENGADE